MYDFAFVFQKSEPSHTHMDIEFFYVLDGTALFTLEGRQYRLAKDDFLVVNVDKSHAYRTEGDFLGACLHISYSRLCSLLKQSIVFFWCNTAAGNPEACDELRRIFRKIVSEEYLNQGRDVIYLNSLFYELLHVLTTDFLLSQGDEHYSQQTQNFDARKQQIAEYIQNNFDKSIRLEDLSGHLFLSYAYLSKYIKRTFGMGFAEYLNQVRLNFAVSQLLHTDLSIVRIAMESGFASSAALNKAFRQAYSMTPTEYRRQWIQKNGASPTGQQAQTDIRKQLERHFDHILAPQQETAKQSALTVALQNPPKRVLKRNWCKMINIGTAVDLLQSDVQNHLLILHQELQFEYVRFWDLHSRGMQLGDARSGFNFNKLDQAIDFLLQNGMKPYIELRPKPKKVLRSAFDVIQQDNFDITEDMGEICNFIRKLFIHLLNRYNARRLETWYFEFWSPESEQNPAERDILPLQKRYLALFETVAGQIRELCPGVRIGGAGLSLRFGPEPVQQLLALWQKSTQQPDFISLYYFPYLQNSEEKFRNQSRNTGLLRQTLEQTRQSMERSGFGDKPLHVTEWNFSLSHRNALNDSCMKGAYLVRDILEGLELADIMGYWVGSDLFGAHSDSLSRIYGGGGLLSRDGIRKPAFYAFDFMNHMGRYVRKREDSYIVPDNGNGNWRIVCHNLKNLNHQYSLMNEGEILISQQDTFFEDLKKRTIHFSLPGKRSETYLLKCLTVNQHYGSLQDEWVSMSSPEDMSRDEIKYLSRIVTPKMVVKRLVSENGKLSFDITMEPNEITYLHLTHQFTE